MGLVSVDKDQKYISINMYVYITKTQKTYFHFPESDVEIISLKVLTACESVERLSVCL